MTCKDTLFSPFCIPCGEKILDLRRPVVMGILNITDDSFYAASRNPQPEQMLARAKQILDEGGSIIDIGAVSTRPGAKLLPPDEECRRLVPAVKRIREVFPDAIISVDTCFAKPAEAAILAGADIINDISGGQFDEQLFPVVANSLIPYILTHYDNTIPEGNNPPMGMPFIEAMKRWLEVRLEALYRLGSKNIILDPGLGFGKTLEQNYEALEYLDHLCASFQEPWLIGLSRKSMIYKRLGCTPAEALNGTTALHAKALMKGARILRVHDVKEAVECVKLLTPCRQ